MTWPMLPPWGFPAALFTVPAIVFVKILAIASILVLGVFAFLLVRLTRNGNALFVTRCPRNGARAVVLLHCSRGGYDDVLGCSQWAQSAARRCDRRCVDRIAA